MNVYHSNVQVSETKCISICIITITKYWLDDWKTKLSTKPLQSYCVHNITIVQPFNLVS